MTIYTIFATLLLIVSLGLMAYEIQSYHISCLEKDEEFLCYSKRRFHRRVVGITVILLIIAIIYLQEFIPSLTNTPGKLWIYLGICFVLIFLLFIVSFLDLKETVYQIKKGKDNLLENSSEELEKFLSTLNEQKKYSNKNNEKTFSSDKNNNN